MMASSDSPALDRSVAPPPGPIRPFHLPPIRSDRLDNGLRLRSIARTDVPLVSGCLVLDAGEAALDDSRAGLAVLSGDALHGGTERLPGAELAEVLEGLGTSLRVSTGWDATTVGFTCLAERLDRLMELLAEVVRTPAFPEDEVERVRRQRLAAIRQRRMEPARLADDELDREVFPEGHPYRRPLAGVPEAVEGHGREDVRAYAEGVHRPGRGGFVLVGDLPEGRIRELAERAFGDWQGDPPPVPRLPEASPRDDRTVVLVHRPGAVQSEIRIGHPGPPRGVEDEDALRVANTILGGAFTSRLNLNLRERHGFTYGASSRVAFRRQGGAVTIGTAVGTETTGPALREAMTELVRFREEGPTREEVEQARDYLVGIFPLRVETTAQLAARAAELLIFGLPDDHHHGYRDRIRAVTRDEAGRAARRRYLPEEASIVVVGDADRVRPQVEELALGEVEVREP